mgnify:CR=1 FL=1
MELPVLKNSKQKILSVPLQFQILCTKPVELYDTKYYMKMSNYIDKSSIYIKSDLHLVTDLQNCVKAQQNAAYARKVKLSNLKEMAKTVSEKTNDSLEINKLIGEINLTKGNIQSFQRELGEHFWAKFVTGEQFDDEAMMICDKIVAAQDKIHRMPISKSAIKFTAWKRRLRKSKPKGRQERQSVKRNAQNARRQKRRRRQSRRQKGRALKRSLCLSARNAARCLPRDRNSAVNVASR